MTLPEPARTAWRAHRATILKIAGAREPRGRAVLHGGTILGMRWRHRASEDLDIFMPERANLTDIWPGKPRDIEKSTGGKAIKKTFRQIVVELPEGGKLDIAAARWKLTGEPSTVEIDGEAQPVLDNAQILHGKLHRVEEAPVRDAFDLIAAAKLDPDALERAVNALTEDQARHVAMSLINHNKRFEEEAEAKLINVRDELKTPHGTMGIDGARAVDDHRYTRVSIRLAGNRIEIETATEARPPNSTAGHPKEADAAEVLKTAGLADYMEHNHGLTVKEIGLTLDRALTHGWRGTAFDTSDSEPWRRVAELKRSLAEARSHHDVRPRPGGATNDGRSGRPPETGRAGAGGADQGGGMADGTPATRHPQTRAPVKLQPVNPDNIKIGGGGDAAVPPRPSDRRTGTSRDRNSSKPREGKTGGMHRP